MSHDSEWLSLLGDSGWLAMAHVKMKTRLWFENSFIVTNNFIVTNGTEPYTLRPEVEPKEPNTGADYRSFCLLKFKRSANAN